MTIREATRDDIEPIREVARRSWERDPPGVVSRETVTDRVDEWYGPERLADDIDRPRALVLVADEGDVVGFSHAVLSDETGHVLRLYVHPDHREEGLGTALLTATRDALFDRGAETLRAMVLTENELGNAFYREYGFEPIGEEETTIGGEPHPETTYVLERTADQEQSPAT